MRMVLLVLLALFVVSCDQGPVAPPTAVDGPAFTFTNNPDNGNVRIYRYETGFRICWTDFSNGLRVCNGTFPLEGEPDCDVQEESAPLEGQQVVKIDPDNYWASEVHDLMKGEVFITVRNTAVEGTCYNNQLIAEGWGKFVITDNDLFGTVPGESNTNSFGWRSHGILTTPTGENVSYMGHVRWLYSNNREEPKLLFRTVRITR